MTQRLLEGLNPAQREAVQFMDGPLLILAGPGSGKTRVVTHRIAWLLEQNIPGYSIAALTFTNKAAEEMKNRLEVLRPANRVWIGTFHRFCSWILRRYIDYSGLEPNFTIYDTDESRRLIETLIDRRDLPNGVDAGKILSAISWAKNGMVLPSDYRAEPGHPVGEWVEKVYSDYQESLRRANAVDFDDLLVRVALLLKRHAEIRQQLDYRFRYILVDEYQDTNLVQYAIARSLSIDYPNLAVTGDPDQSIYGWRGANLKNILEFEKDFEKVTVIRLEENYRSTKNILAVAQGLIKNNKYRKEKELFTANGEGPKPRVLRCFNHQEEAESIAREIATEIASGRRSPRDYAIFFRMNALSRNLEHSLRRLGVPFQLVRGLEFFNRKEIKDLIAYLQLVYNPSDTISFLRVVNLPVRGIGAVTLGRMKNYAESRSLSMMNAAREVEKIPQITPRTAKLVASFAKLVDRLAEQAVTGDLEVLLSFILRETHYTAEMEKSNDEEDKQRLANVQELLSEVREFDRRFDEQQAEEKLEPTTLLDHNGEASRLGAFLETAALVSDTDAWDESNRVSLMTLHAAKGLEFPVVYIIALEDNILPHERSLGSKRQIEEERRLLFVGMTRAKEELRMSRTEYREYRGTYCSSILSRFLFELPKEKLDLVDSRGLTFAEIRTDQSENVEGEEEEEDFSRPNHDGDRMAYLSDYLRKAENNEENEAWSESEENADDGEIRIEYDDQPKRRKKEKSPRRKSGKSQTGAGGRNAGGRKRSAEGESADDSGIRLERDEYCEPVGESTEIVFDPDGNAAEIPVVSAKKRKKSSPASFSILPPIQTAAELTDSNEDDPSKGEEEKQQKRSELLSDKDVDWRVALKPGVILRHPNYGIGVLKSLDGPTGDRIATIEFFSGVGIIQVPLADESLAPVKKRPS